jgi:hypothetical protein
MFAAAGGAALAQSPSGVSVGLGMGVYHGEFDGNPGNGVIRAAASAMPFGFVAVDQPVGPVVAEAGLTYHYFPMRSEPVDKNVHSFSIDLLAHVAVPLELPLRLGVFGGASAAAQFQSHERVLPGWRDRVGYDPAAVRIAVSFPVGITLQEAVRISVRVAPPGWLDGFDGGRSSFDAVSSVAVAYRFQR